MGEVQVVHGPFLSCPKPCFKIRVMAKLLVRTLFSQEKFFT